MKRPSVDLTILAGAAVLLVTLMGMPARAASVEPLDPAAAMDGRHRVDVSAGGFAPGEDVRVLLEPTGGTGETWAVAALAAGPNGDVSLDALTLPAGVPSGTYLLTVQSIAGGRRTSTPLTLAADYAQYRHGAVHDGFNAQESTLSAANVGGLRQLWSFTTGGMVRSSAAVVNGTVYFGSGDAKVYALDALSGSLKWSFTTGGAVDGSPAVDAGKVIVGSADGLLYALDALSGAKLWSYRAGSAIVTSPTVAGGLVYFSASNGYLYCVNEATGALRFSTFAGSYAGSPSVNYGKVFVPGSYNLLAFDALTGARKWEARQLVGYQTSPATGGGLVFIGLIHGVAGIDAATGRQVWAMSVGPRAQPTFGSPAYANGTVYQGYTAGVVAIDATTGITRWDANTLGNTGGAVIANGVVYASSYSASLLNELSPASGAKLAGQSVPRGSMGASRTDPVVANGVVYVGSDAGQMIAFGL